MGYRTFTGLIMAAAVLAACAAPTGSPGGSRGGGQAASPEQSGPRGNIRMAWAGEPPTLSPKMAAPGGTAFNELAVTFNSALTYTDPQGNIVPQIAKEIPSTDNGSWVVNADGTMVTTYR